MVSRNMYQKTYVLYFTMLFHNYLIAKIFKYQKNGQEIENNGQQENNPELPEEVYEKSHKRF